jgi:TolB-like protein/tetratricopeptide (TPR) repeat protein
MGEVYRATDTKLDRDVALKVLPAEMASHRERLERFRREAKALAALDHPGIVTVFSIEEADNIQFLTMQLVEGSSLDELIPANGLPPERIIEIGIELADALKSAHERGIVHRDLKPSNVMVTNEGRVKVLDFGLARIGGALADASAESALPTELLTREGVVMGTVPFMSPEQVSGKDIDHRTDLFSLGVILYEMAGGELPFQASSSAELASAILRDSPRPLDELRSDLPPHVVQVIERCLEKSPEARFSSAEEVRSGLRESGAEDRDLRDSGAPVECSSSGMQSEEGFWVAVLPFRYAGADADVAALAEGLTEEIVTGLSRFSYLRVVARSSLEAFAGGVDDVRAVGSELGARFLMQGSLRQGGAKLRVAVQLVDATTGAHLWAESYDRAFEPDSVFDLQDELVPRIVSTVADMNGILPRSMGEALRSRPPDQLPPYEAVLRSFAYFQRVTAEELAAAHEAVELAARTAPEYADAWALLALLSAQDYGQGFGVLDDPLGSGTVAARRAVECGPSNHLAYFSLAQVLFFRRERQAFRNAADKAVALNPMDGNSIAFMGELLIYLGDIDRGLELAGRAKELNPHHPGWYWYADYFNAYREGDYEAALEYASKANLPGHWGEAVAIGAASAQLGKLERAEKAVRKLLQLRPDFADTARTELGKWFAPEFVDQLIEGLRKAGLERR